MAGRVRAGDHELMSTLAHQPVPMTREGFDRLRAELKHLVTAKRREVADWLRVARDDGGEPGENLDVAAALYEQAMLERRIDELEATLALARIPDPPAEGIAGIGQRVQIRLRPGAEPSEYHLVGAAEAEPTKGRISVDSPIGRALQGRRAGDTVDVDTPGGARTVEIVAVGS
jgi:transcription elongation factor GreA